MPPMVNDASPDSEPDPAPSTQVTLRYRIPQHHAARFEEKLAGLLRAVPTPLRVERLSPEQAPQVHWSVLVDGAVVSEALGSTPFAELETAVRRALPRAA